MPKPSERIRELHIDYIEKGQAHGIGFQNAVLTYLDEQHEQNKPCEHECREEFSMGNVFKGVEYNRCIECKVLLKK